MGLDIIYEKTSKFSMHKFLRFDVKYWKTIKKFNKRNVINLKSLFDIYNGNSFTEYYSNEKTSIPYIRIGDLTFKYDINNENMIYLNEEVDINEEKVLKENDLIMATIGATIGKINLVRQYKGGTFSNNTVLLRLKSSRYSNPFFYEKLFQSQYFQEYIFGVVSQKSQPNLQTYDLENIKTPIISIEIQNRILSELKPKEKNISKLRSSLIPQVNIINNVFTKYFNFDVEQFERIKKIKQYSLSFSKFSNNKDLRQSVKFHRKSGQFIYKELQKITDKKIKHFISEQILLGSSISPEYYDENGDYYYVSMGDIRTWYLDKENCKTVSNLYSTSNMNKTIQKNDIIMARSGEGTIGKVSIIEDDIIQGIFCDFTMRIRVKNCNPKFVYYYFRTDYFQYLIEINKKGLGNNTNIFPIQLQELPMIDIPIAEQNKIVKLIETEIKKQNEIQEQIEQERKKIDLIIIKSIK